MYIICVINENCVVLNSWISAADLRAWRRTPRWALHGLSATARKAASTSACETARASCGQRRAVEHTRMTLRHQSWTKEPASLDLVARKAIGAPKALPEALPEVLPVAILEL